MAELDRPVILLADDEPWNLEVLESFYEGRGYVLKRAANGEEALAAVGEHFPDLVLLDVMMPGMDGFEVCRKLKRAGDTCFIPVVMVTSLDRREDRLMAIEAGADDFLTKPVDEAELLARSASLLRLKRYHDEREKAYSDIRSITSFFNSVVAGFDPLEFSISSAYRLIFSAVLRPPGSCAGQPSHALVTHAGKGGRRESVLYSKAADGTLLERGFDLALPEPSAILGGEGGDCFINLDGQGCAAFPEAIRAETGGVMNFTRCRSNGTTVVCMNYGRAVGVYDLHVIKDLAAHSAFLDTLAGQVKENEDALLYTIKALARAAEANDEDTGNHIVRVNEFSYEIAKELGLPPKLAEEIRYSAQMHDVGKIHTPAEILKKPGALTREEWDEVKRHTVYGVKILGGSPRLETARTIALGHHERWDGSGYPAGLKGEEIPVAARVVAIGDVYDALRNKRVYKPGFDHETAHRIITVGDGRTHPGHFDPDVLSVFKRVARRFEEIYSELGDHSTGA